MITNDDQLLDARDMQAEVAAARGECAECLEAERTDCADADAVLTDIDLVLEHVAQPPTKRDFSAVLREWHDVSSRAIRAASPASLDTITDLALLGNRLLLESNLLGQSSAFETAIRQKRASDQMFTTHADTEEMGRLVREKVREVKGGGDSA